MAWLAELQIPERLWILFCLVPPQLQSSFLRAFYIPCLNGTTRFLRPEYQQCLDYNYFFTPRNNKPPVLWIPALISAPGWSSARDSPASNCITDVHHSIWPRLQFETAQTQPTPPGHFHFPSLVQVLAWQHLLHFGLSSVWSLPILSSEKTLQTPHSLQAKIQFFSMLPRASRT